MKQQRSKVYFLPVLFLILNLACNGLEILPIGLVGEAHYYIFQEMTNSTWQVTPQVLAISNHIHPDAHFAYVSPDGWEIHNSKSGIIIYSPESVVFSVSLLNTGYKISDASLTNLVTGIEKNHYASQSDYQMIKFNPQPVNHTVSSEKTYRVNGVLKFTRSIYQQNGTSLFIIEMTGDSSEIASDTKYNELFNTFSRSIKPQASTIASLPAYNSYWTFNTPHQTLSISIPLGWQQSSDRQIGKVSQEEFWAPDRNAVIESITVDTGEVVQLNFAGDYAIGWLNSRYSDGFKDVKILSEVIMNDQIEKVEWTSRRGGYSGVTFFEIHDKTKVVVLTTAWSRLFADIYSPVMDVTLLSYMADNKIQ
ncbi:MAG: hypothetical protein U0Z26_00955 [Anaerolineales bacterium]